MELGFGNNLADIGIPFNILSAPTGGCPEEDVYRQRPWKRTCHQHASVPEGKPRQTAVLFMKDAVRAINTSSPVGEHWENKAFSSGWVCSKHSKRMAPPLETFWIKA